MSLQNSVSLRNAKIAAEEAHIGTSPVLKLRVGAPPANCAAADSGVVVSTMTLPSDWLAAPSGGSAAQSGA